MSEKKSCPWCKEVKKPGEQYKLEWTVIDDDFGQPVHSNLIRYCFSCGRALYKEEEIK